MAKIEYRRRTRELTLVWPFLFSVIPGKPGIVRNIQPGQTPQAVPGPVQRRPRARLEE